jgi:hypothetical protein
MRERPKRLPGGIQIRGLDSNPMAEITRRGLVAVERRVVPRLKRHLKMNTRQAIRTRAVIEGRRLPQKIPDK